MDLVGLNKFVLIFKIDHLIDYVQNDFEIFNIDNIKNQIIKYASSLLVRPSTNPCGVSKNHIDQYNYYIFNKEYNLIRIDELFIPNNKQIVVLLNKDILPPEECNIVYERIVRYISNRMPEFYRLIEEGLFQNIEYDGYKFDQFDFLTK